jgi:cytosine deaminase
VRQFGFGTVVVGESKNFQGGIDWLRSLGVRLIDLESIECASLLAQYIRANPAVWNEDIGEE